MTLRVLIIVLLGTQCLFSAVESVNWGEPCSPIIPSLFCNQGAAMACRQQEAGNFQCECISGNTPTRAGEMCMGTYDELCILGQPSFNCNNDRHVRCSDTTIIGHGRCKCTDRPNTIFNEETETCLGVSGTICDPNSDTVWGYNCGPNSFCDENRQCKCDDGYAPNTQRSCLRINAEYGASCNSNADCDFNILHLECNITSNTCHCAETYSKNSTGQCMRDFGARCSSLDPCHSEKHQKCSSFSAWPGNCRCEIQDWQVYHQEKDACVTKVGHICGPERYGIECVDDAECLLDQAENKHLCKCKEGFIMTHDKYCRARTPPELGDPCDPAIMSCSADSMSLCSANGSDDDTYTCQCPAYSSANGVGTRCYRRHGEYCSDSQGLYCNEDRWLECRYLGCRCIPSRNQVWHADRDLCVALVDGYCTGGHTEFDIQCVDNAYCDYTDNLRRCKCLDGFEQIANRTCTPIP